MSMAYDKPKKDQDLERDYEAEEYDDLYDGEDDD